MNKNQCLFEYKYDVDEKEYKKLSEATHVFLPDIIIIYSMYGIILSIFLCGKSSSLPFIIESLFLILIFIIVGIYCMPNYAVNTFKKKFKSYNYHPINIIEFYDNYLIIKTENSVSNINYIDFSKCIETNTNFYFKHPANKSYLILKKENCSDEFIIFLKSNFKFKKKRGIRV